MNERHRKVPFFFAAGPSTRKTVGARLARDGGGTSRINAN
jgi:hypothetical protein